MALHEQCLGATDEWYTPPYIFDAMGAVFDVDVAHPGAGHAAWVPARVYMTEKGLETPWKGFVWMNPPFGGRNGLVPWLKRFTRHANGVALVPDRTSAPWWQVFARSVERVLFISPKVKFIGRDGQMGKSPAQGTCLMSLGGKGREAIERASTLGVLMERRL